VIRNLIFDWSGTLVDDLPAVLRASNHVFRLAGVPELTLDQFRAEFCLPFKRFYDRYVPAVPLRQLEEWFHGEFRQSQHLVVELPHAREFLTFCRQHGLRTFLLSSVHREHFAVQSAVTGFREFLDHPYVEVWDKTAKIVELLKEHGLAPRETLLVGDMEHDIETARHGGVRSCAVLTGYNRREQLEAAHPDLIVNHLGELQELLAGNRLELEWLQA
jgi:phosphoglycolate phosphatase